MNQPSPESGARKPLQPLEVPGPLTRIKSNIVVLSGKGGVGKSTVAANLAVGLALEGLKTGLLDIDVHGPSIPRLMGLTGAGVGMAGDFMLPVEWNWNLKVLSMGFFLPDPGTPVIWRGAMKGGVIEQFLNQVVWGDLDCLVVDCPPGTGDEPLSVLQILGKQAAGLIVTSPQDVAIDDVRRSVGFCRELGNPILGIVENLSGFSCPDCGAVHQIFSSGGGERLARETGVPFLGRIPIEPGVGQAADQGEAFLAVKGATPAAVAFRRVVQAGAAFAAARGAIPASGEAPSGESAAS